jgi:uncharacterized protein (DUF2147 family)
MRKVLLALIGLAGLATQAQAADARGVWFVEGKTGTVRVEACGPRTMCGFIASTQYAGKDENNPDPAKRDRSIVGVQILLAMKQTEPNRWDGEIYNPENGKIYTGRIILKSENELRIEGCVLGFLCGGQNWERAPAGAAVTTTGTATKQGAQVPAKQAAPPR